MGVKGLMGGLLHLEETTAIVIACDRGGSNHHRSFCTVTLSTIRAWASQLSTVYRTP